MHLSALAATPAAAQPRPTFVLVEVNQTMPYFTQLIDGAQKAAARNDADLIVYNANNDPVAQYNGIMTYIQQKVSGIILVAIDPNAIMPAVKLAAASGIPIVALDTVLPAGPQKAQVSFDQALGGKLLADLLVKDLAGRKAKLAVVGASGSPNQGLREKSFEEALKPATNVALIATVDGRNNRDNSKSAVESVLQAHHDLDAVYATSGQALLGAIATVEAWNKQSTLKIVGWDLDQKAVEGIDAGYVLGVVRQDSAAEAGAAVDSLARLVHGGSVDASTVLPVTIVTKQNVDAYRSSVK